METKQAELVTMGLCSNYGDVLLEAVVRKLFETDLRLRLRPVRIDVFEDMGDNILIGAGGLFTGSPNASTPDCLLIRHLSVEKIRAWERGKKKLVCFGTGTNADFLGTFRPITKKSGMILSTLFDFARKIFVRGHHDIVRLSSFVASPSCTKFAFQPCPSLFLQQLYALSPRISDRVAVSFPFKGALTVENYQKHPIRRFLDACRANGLEPVFFDNHSADTSLYGLELFNSFQHSSEHLSSIRTALQEEEEALAKGVPTAKAGLGVSKLYTKIWSSYVAHDMAEDTESGFGDRLELPERFNGFRFAFGNRLHAFLPFMAFDTPSIFLSNFDIRRPMPLDYFDNPVFGAKVKHGGGTPDEVTDGMIERLEFFIKYESALRCQIKEKREELWELTLRNKKEVLEILN